MPEPFRSRSRALRETEIVAVAEDRLARRGCSDLSVYEVASQVGIANGTIYLHFRTRAELIRRVLTEVAERNRALLHEMLQDSTPTAAIAKQIKASLRYADEHAATTGLRQLPYPCCLQRLHCPYGDTDTVVALIARLFERTHVEGQGRTVSGDSMMLARWFRAVLGDLLSRERTPDTVQELQTEIDMAVRLFEGALSSPPGNLD